MPELPEVHTTVEGLKNRVLGKTIQEVWSDFHMNTAHGERKTIKNKKYYVRFRKAVTGAKIIKIERRGKNIIFNLDNKISIIVHMKMTGHFLIENFEKEKKFIHLIFYLSGNKQLAFSDIRKFASVTFCNTEELERHENVGKLGPDPLDPDFSSEKFYKIIRQKKRMPIKSALLDQTLVSGIGNIYSDEILWQTGVHPLSFADKIPEKKIVEIFRAAKKILLLSIKHGGDSKTDYRNISGEKGGFQKFHKAYGRKGDGCPKMKCGGIIERTVIRGRSSHFCPVHQIIYK